MKSVPSGQQRKSCDSGSPEELYIDTIQFIGKAMSLEPNELEREVEEAERKVVKLRDCLIERLRKDAGNVSPSRWRKPLDQVNVALSLIAAVEYPATGIHRSYMEDATKVLRAVEFHLSE
jgi:TolA-binding protein